MLTAAKPYLRYCENRSIIGTVCPRADEIGAPGVVCRYCRHVMPRGDVVELRRGLRSVSHGSQINEEFSDATRLRVER